MAARSEGQPAAADESPKMAARSEGQPAAADELAQVRRLAASEEPAGPEPLKKRIGQAAARLAPLGELLDGARARPQKMTPPALQAIKLEMQSLEEEVSNLQLQLAQKLQRQIGQAEVRSARLGELLDDARAQPQNVTPPALQTIKLEMQLLRDEVSNLQEQQKQKELALQLLQKQKELALLRKEMQTLEQRIAEKRDCLEKKN